MERHPRRIMNDANEHEEEEFEDMLDDDVVPLEEGMLLGDPAELFWGRQDDEDDDPARHREESRRQVEQNDPSLLSIDVGSDEYDYMPRNGNWEASGASFGRNTHIKEILISLNSTQMGVHFFRGLVLNRSIEKLVFPCVEFQNDDTFLLMLPFFMNNQAFNHLEIGFEGQNCSGFYRDLSSC